MSGPSNPPAPKLHEPFSVSAEVYDVIYHGMPYREQADRIAQLVRTRNPSAQTALEVGCGTGRFLVELRRHFDQIEGLDISQDMLNVAVVRCPDVPLHLADMRTFDLHDRFDAVLCLFSSIGYMVTTEELKAAVANMARHLAPGGVMVIDPWLTPQAWRAGHVGLDVEERDGTAVARMSTGEVHGEVSVLDMHHLVGRSGEPVRYYVERHRMGLFSNDDYMTMFGELGFTAERLDDLAFIERNRYVCVRDVTSES